MDAKESLASCCFCLCCSVRYFFIFLFSFTLSLFSLLPPGFARSHAALTYLLFFLLCFQFFFYHSFSLLSPLTTRVCSVASAWTRRPPAASGCSVTLWTTRRASSAGSRPCEYRIIIFLMSFFIRICCFFSQIGYFKLVFALMDCFFSLGWFVSC